MRILMVAESFLPRTNGVVNTVMRVARFLRDSGNEVLILAPGLSGSRNFEGIEIVRIPSVLLPGIQNIDVAFTSTNQIAKIIRKFQPDVIHLASPFILGERAAKAAKQEGVPTVGIFQTDVAGFAVHYGLAFAMRAADAWVGRIHRMVDVNLVPCGDMDSYLRALGVENIHRWTRGVDHALFSAQNRSSSLRASWGANDDTQVIGFVGRLAPEKNAHKLALLSRRLNTKVATKVVIVGDGSERAALQRLLPDAVFTGELHGKELGEAMASLDILVAPGEKETFCQVIQEGMASGVVVIAPNVGGPKDLIQHGVNGLLYSPGRDDLLVNSVEAVLNNADFELKLREEGIRSVAFKTWSSVNSELIEHYSNVITLNEVKRGAAA